MRDPSGRARDRLLIAAALIFAVAGALHLRGFPVAVAAADGSTLAPRMQRAFAALWLMDSAGLFTLAATCAWVSVRRARVDGAVLCLLAAMPASVAVLLYRYLGSFVGAHVVLIGALLVIGAGMSTPRPGVRGTGRGT